MKTLKTLKQYGVLISFVVLFVVGLIIWYALGENSALWGIWGAIDIAFAVALGVLAFFAYRDMVHDDDEVQLCFNVNGREVDTGLCLLRKDCTRGEVIGVLGMMQRITENRFKYDAAHLHDLLDEVNRVQRGESDKLLVIISDKEFEQFELSKKD
jgi:hypothetical protein